MERRGLGSGLLLVPLARLLSALGGLVRRPPAHREKPGRDGRPGAVRRTAKYLDLRSPAVGGPARLRAIDALRATAALAVVLHHSPHVDGPLSFLRPIQELGSAGVGLFLVLSGFSIHYRWASNGGEQRFSQRRFWRRRFIRL